MIVTVQRVVKSTTGQVLDPGDRVPRVARELLVALIKVDGDAYAEIGVLDPINAAAAVDSVVAGATEQKIIARSAEQLVVSTLAEQDVVVFLALKRVRTAPACQDVVAAPTFQNISEKVGGIIIGEQNVIRRCVAVRWRDKRAPGEPNQRIGRQRVDLGPTVELIQAIDDRLDSQVQLIQKQVFTETFVDVFIDRLQVARCDGRFQLRDRDIEQRPRIRNKNILGNSKSKTIPYTVSIYGPVFHRINIVPVWLVEHKERNRAWHAPTTRIDVVDESTLRRCKIRRIRRPIEDIFLIGFRRDTEKKLNCCNVLFAVNKRINILREVFRPDANLDKLDKLLLVHLTRVQKNAGGVSQKFAIRVGLPVFRSKAGEFPASCLVDNGTAHVDGAHQRGDQRAFLNRVLLVVCDEEHDLRQGARRLLQR